MNRRLELHKKLVEILGSEHVYFQPPESLKLVYPCIVYTRSGMSIAHADDNPYTTHYNYSITVIDKNPDSEIVDRMANFKSARYDRSFKVDNLNHDVFYIYF